MPGFTTPYGLPYPLIGEATTPQAVQDLAEAADLLSAQQAAAVEAAISGQNAVILTGANQTVETGAVFENAVFNTVVLDQGGLSALAVNPDSITVRQAGTYLVHGYVQWDGGTTGSRAIDIFSNIAPAGSLPLSDMRSPATSTGQVQQVASLQGAVNHQTFQLRMSNNSASNRTAVFYRIAVIRIF